MREVLFKWTDCLCVQHFVDDCNGSCSAAFMGLTLPVNVTGVQHLEWNGQHVPVTAHVSHSPRSVYGGAAYPGTMYSPMATLPRGMSAEFLTFQPCLENDLPRHYQGVLIFKSSSPADKNKLVGIRYMTHKGDIVREDIALSEVGFETSRSPARVLELTFPPGRCGWITVLTEDGYVLGTYHPSVGSPKHRRIRLAGFTGCRGGSTIDCEGQMEPLNVYFDTDRVEVASEVDWENGIMALDLHFKTGKSAAEFQTLAQATQFAAGASDAELRAQQDVPVANLRPRGVSRALRKISFLEREWPWRG